MRAPASGRLLEAVAVDSSHVQTLGGTYSVVVASVDMVLAMIVEDFEEEEVAKVLGVAKAAKVVDDTAAD